MGVGAQYECVCMCVHVCVYCGGRQVDSAASSLTPTTPAIGTDKSLPPNALIQTHTYDTHSKPRTCTKAITHTFTQRLALKDRCTQTHSPKPNPFPEINYLKPNKNTENKTNLFSCFPLPLCLITVSRQAFGRSVRLSVVS